MHSFNRPDDSRIINTCSAAEALMNAGFSAKELQRHDEALKAFLGALAAQPSMSIVPYLIIEIGSILKNKGSYDEAVLLFSNAQKSSALLCNQPLQREFINMIAYLRITKNILLSKRLGLIPFSHIPPAVITEIDAEYAEWSRLEEAI